MNQATLVALEVDEMICFVAQLETEIPGISLQRTFNARLPLVHHDKEAGFVNDGSLLAFTDNVLPECKQAVLNTCLLAQLTANKKYSRWRETQDWYRCYEEVLLNTGWAFNELHFSPAASDERTVKLQDLVLRQLSEIATDEEVLAASATVQALKALESNDRRLVLFDTQSQALGRGNFQVGTVTTNGSGVVMNLGAYCFSAMATRFRFLWYGYNTRHTEIFSATRRAVLNMEIYRRVEGLIQDKLKDNGRIYFGDLNI